MISVKIDQVSVDSLKERVLPLVLESITFTMFLKELLHNLYSILDVGPWGSCPYGMTIRHLHLGNVHSDIDVRFLDAPFLSLVASEKCTIPVVTCQALYSPLFMYKFHHFLNLSTF